MRTRKKKNKNRLSNTLFAFGILFFVAAIGFTGYNMLRSEKAADTANDDLSELRLLINHNVSIGTGAQNSITEYSIYAETPETESDVSTEIYDDSYYEYTDTYSVPAESGINTVTGETVPVQTDNNHASVPVITNDSNYSAPVSDNNSQANAPQSSSVNTSNSAQYNSAVTQSNIPQNNTSSAQSNVPQNNTSSAQSNVPQNSTASAQSNIPQNNISSTNIQNNQAVSVAPQNNNQINNSQGNNVPVSQPQGSSNSVSHQNSNTSSNNTAVNHSTMDSKPESEQEKKYPDMPVQKVGAREYIGILSIPRIDLELPIQSKYSDKNVEAAPCLYAGNILADNLVFCAHNFPKHFGKLSELKPGDKVTFTDVLGKDYVYVVKLIETLAPTDVDEMKAGEYDLSLFTCTTNSTARVTVRLDRK